ncbi:glucose/galactose MFS transporter [Pedobacter frigiditerrae]|uniref:Glucose/galactose MFS transporter n=1 Tax=Pedobacter frigiditerrae TaxID=2530452 RepID=A0A4R0MKM2_9SPHI|nr:sugar MFS transporter [Pedobacter frigiditerrae]TCC86947.1 glucose/galactose MFS transporter [Pedobacter frigiditerrae]
MAKSTTQSQNNYKAIATIGALFFIFGFVTWANSTLIPFLKIACNLKTDLEAFFVTFASYMAYFVLALPSSWILKKVGFRNGIILGLVILGLGSLIFIPAADSKSYGLFLTGIFIQGAALALLQTASNPYISIIGPIESAAKRISIMGLCNKFAGIIVPIIMGSIFLKNSEAITKKLADVATTASEKDALLTEVLGRVHTPYITLAIVFVIFAIFIRFSNLPEVDVDKEEVIADDASHTAKTSIFQFPHLFLGAFCIFVYVAAEVMAGDIIGVYAKEFNLNLFITTIKITDSLSVPLYYTTLTLASMLVGYVIGVFTIPKYISQQAALKICAILGLAFTLGAFATHGYTSVIFVALLGLANSLMWPAIFPLGIKGLGKFTKTGSAIMIMGIAGGAIWPLLYGYLKDELHVNFQLSFFISMMPCYLFILYFAISGHKVGLKNLHIEKKN